MEELIDLTSEDASALVSGPELAHLRDIVSGGASSDRQRAVFRATRDAGATEDEALRSVVESLISEFSQGLPR